MLRISQLAALGLAAEVRGNHRRVQAGVTLGDVRRGWRGACD